MAILAKSVTLAATRHANRESHDSQLSGKSKWGLSKWGLKVLVLDGPNRQSPIASHAASVQRTRSTLAGHSAVPHGTNVKRMDANRAIRIAAQRTQGL